MYLKLCFKTYVMTSSSGSMWPRDVMKNPQVTKHVAMLGAILQA